ncbi:DMT family transporter [Massilia soli]|uniref:DMT family transporter n=1 Tax=Massilia soli TaxID=2792854 RepID=A0ABS7SSH8_9BURK|nr:DMT family transporter [Massilia soli]MBZ2208901.1 DMT family transporter [Massilia soli]
MASLWMLLASFSFAAMGAAVKLASELYSTSEIVMYRGMVGTIMLLLLVRHQGGTFRTALPKEHLWRGFVGVISLWLWFYAIGELPLATAVTLNYLAPIWIALYLALMGWLRGKHHVEWPMLLAVSASFVGVVLALQPAVESEAWLGATVAIASSLLSAMAYMQVRRLGKMGEPEYRVVFYFSLITVVFGLVGTLAPSQGGEPSLHAHSWYSAGLLVAVGFCATIAQMAMTRAYRVGNVLVVANLQYTGIIFSSLWGMALWGDVFDWHVWLGMGVILVSGVAATFYNTRSTPPAGAVRTDPIASEL